MIKDIKEINFPKREGEEKSYATFTQATAQLQDMAEKTITAQVKIDGGIAPDFSYDWEVEFKGEKYIMPLREPQAAKENTSLDSTIDLTFQHWAVYQLKRWYFFTVQPVETGTAVPNKYIAPVTLNLGDFCILFRQVLNYYCGEKITIDFNDPATHENGFAYKIEPTTVEISNSYIWDVLIKFYELFGVRWTIEPRTDNNNEVDDGERYVIKVGYPTSEISHIFKYGFEGGLLKVERQVQDENIRNMIIGRGGSKNLPYRYFKDTDPGNPDFKADPDWVPELANIPFTELYGATFRSYIQGWKTKHYGGASVSSASGAYAPWAWMRGYTDAKFNPVEYVADEFDTDGNGYNVVTSSSIDKYGPLLGGLENNEEIYPSLRAEAIAVEQVQSDDVEEAAQSDAETTNLSGLTPTDTRSITKNSRIKMSYRVGYFTIPEGKTGNLDDGVKTVSIAKNSKKVIVVSYEGSWVMSATNIQIPIDNSDGKVIIEKATAKVVDMKDNSVRSASGIPAGDYYFLLELELYNTTGDNLSATVECAEPKVTYATLDDKWAGTFDVWAGNIWETAMESGETPGQYAERVWRPILGDREGDEAKVVFATGQLAASEDYEFTIVRVPEYDDSMSLGGERSHWRLTLAKSDADMESTGLYVPSTKRQGSAGDSFFFIGIDMPHMYVVKAEERLDDYKKDALLKAKGIKPAWVVGLDKVRIHNYGKANALVEHIRPGASLTLFDERFIPGSHQEKLYLQSVTYTYNEPTETEANIMPDVEVVLSDKYEMSASPVETLQGQIDALQRQVGSISNIQQVVRAVGDKLYLRKDGIADRSMSPTEFASLLTSYGFRSGIVGGRGWGFYKDESGKWVLETDRINVRQDMQVNNLVINQITARGGMIVESAASMEITEAEETAGGYVCRFDQKGGSVGNLFHEGDVAYCSRFTPQNEGLKYYKRRVLAADEGSVTLSKAEKDGDGIPEAGDVIVHYGSYTDPSRRYVKVRDVIGGGYERYIEGLDSVTADGKEYYFVGRQDGSGARWFIGDLDGEYGEYKDRKLTLKCALSIESTVGGKDLVTFVKENGGLNEEVKNYVDSVIQGVQDQIDGVIETWFFNGVPTLANYPASGWGTEELKIQHLGDLYYDNNTGTAYRFSQKADKTYFWNTITDDAITKALAAAQKAQDTADGKRRVFTSQPVPPYDEGDLWVNATYGTQYSDDLLRCVSPKAKGATFAIGDWTLATKYTDDTEVLKLKYIKDALKDFTLINGGLVLSSLISLGLNNEDITSQTTYSGISGLYSADRVGGGIAAWYGGDMLDLAEYYDWDEATQKWVQKPGVSVDGLRIAQGLDRMDGTGYRAGGSLWWDSDGMVHADPLSFFVGEESVGNVLGLFKYWPVNNTPFNRVTSATPQRPFTELRIGTTDGTKSVRLTYDESAGALRVEGNMYSDGDITALGMNPQGGGGGSGVDGMYFGDWTDYASEYDTYAVSGRSGKELYDLIRSAGGVDGSKLGLLTLTRNGVEIGRYNPAVAAAIDIVVPDKTSQLANDSGYLTQHQSLANYMGFARGDYDPNDLTSISVREAYSATNAPTSNAWHQYMTWGTGDPRYTFQMANQYTVNGHLYYRHKIGGVWYPWRAVAEIADITWGNLTGKPTTLAGYGITDAVTLGTTQRITGRKVFTDICLDGQPENLNMPFFLGIDSYADGGAVKYITATKVANAIGAYTKTEADGRYVGKASYTASDVLSKLQTVDGTGSGLDADLLDGNHLADILSSNVASATRLQTARTLWGQSFDGTGNVSGNMTGVGGIVASGESHFAYTGVIYEDPIPGTGAAIKITGVLAQTNGNVLLATHSGNVGIGTTSPAYKLDVNGTARATALLINAGLIEWDASNNAFKFNGNIYATGDITALGMNPQGGSGGGSGVDGMYFGDWTDYASEYDTYAVSGRSGKELYELIRTSGGIDSSKLGLLTLTRNGVEIGRYNPAVAAAIDIPVPTKTSQLANDSGYLTAIGTSGAGNVLTSISGGTATKGYISEFRGWPDTRSVSTSPNDYNGAFKIVGIKRVDKPNSDSYYSIIGYRGWTDDTGGNAWEIGFGNTEMFVRNGSTTTWNAWEKLLTSASSLTWGNLTGKPTTLAGYGITDALPYTALNGGLSACGWSDWGNRTGTQVAEWGDDTGGNFKFHKDNPAAGKISMLIDGTVYINEGVEPVASQNWADGRYVSKAGDTMSGPLHFANNTWNVVGDDVAIGDSNNAGCLGIRGLNGDPGITFFNSQNAGVGQLLVSNNLRFNGNTVWHAGNDGSGSGLDADLLDGVHNGNLTAKLINYNNDGGINGPVQFMQKPAGWNAWDAPSQKWHSVIKLNHGNGDTYFNRTLAFDFFGHRIYTGKMENGTFAGWKTLAFLDDNVASATKLQTARTLWGQSFDGTGNVSGNMTGVGGIVASGESHFAYTGVIYEDPIPGTGAAIKITGVLAQTNGNVLLATHSGNVGIGTTSPAYKLDVNGTARASALLINAGLIEWDASNNAFKFNGNIYATGDITALGTMSQSDMRLKNVIRDFILDIDSIANAPLFIHTWKDGTPGEYAGTSAQYWQSVLPQAVKGSGKLALDYGKTALASVISVAKETMNIKEEIKRLRQRVSELESIHNIIHS